MTKLDLVLARIRQLPPEQQEALAEQIEYALDHQGADSLLTDAQWAEVEAALADDSEPVSPHEDVFARLRNQTAK
ncbi:MAG: hypothetical protein ACK4X1_09710 [Terricaulis sp.]